MSGIQAMATGRASAAAAAAILAVLAVFPGRGGGALVHLDVTQLSGQLTTHRAHPPILAIR